MKQNLQYAPYPQELKDAVSEFYYMEGWRFTLEDTARDFANPDLREGPIAGGLTLVIFVPCYDSYHPEKYRPVEHLHPVPAATYNRQSWERWIFDRLIDTLTHEAGEWAKFNERRPFAALHGPGDNPYVVHEQASELQRTLVIEEW